MIAKYLVLAVFAFGAFAQEDSQDLRDGLDVIRNITSEGLKKVEATLGLLDSAKQEYESMTVDRIEAINWEFKKLKNSMNKSVTDAVSKGILRNKQFNNFHCISKAGRETEEKLDAALGRIPEETKKITEKALSGVFPFRILVPGFMDFIRDLIRNKHYELKQAETAEERINILERAKKKMKLLEVILENINNKLKDSKFEFFAQFVDLMHATETNIRKYQREGCKKIQKCVAWV